MMLGPTVPTRLSTLLAILAMASVAAAQPASPRYSAFQAPSRAAVPTPPTQPDADGPLASGARPLRLSRTAALPTSPAASSLNRAPADGDVYIPLSDLDEGQPNLADPPSTPNAGIERLPPPSDALPNRPLPLIESSSISSR